MFSEFQERLDRTQKNYQRQIAKLKDNQAPKPQTASASTQTQAANQNAPSLEIQELKILRRTLIEAQVQNQNLNCEVDRLTRLIMESQKPKDLKYVSTQTAVFQMAQHVRDFDLSSIVASDLDSSRQPYAELPRKQETP